MPYGVRHSLIALALCLGIPAAAEAQGAAGSTWTDPPVRKPEADKPAAEAPQQSTPAAAAPAGKPKVAARARREPVSRRERTAARAPVVRSRVAVRAPSRRRPVAARPAPARPQRLVAAARPAPEGRFQGYQTYGYGPVYADERLERLRSAAEAGYLIVHRRSVEFPDGRSLRVYHPAEGDEEY